MLRRLSMVFLSVLTVYWSPAVADDKTDRQITESALRESRDIVSRELFGHYDITNLAVLKVEALPARIRLGHDYGLVTATLAFSTQRNTTKHPSLNPEMFEPGNAMCRGREYSLQGYLLLEGREKEGYVLFPKRPER